VPAGLHKSQLHGELKDPPVSTEAGGSLHSSVEDPARLDETNPAPVPFYAVHYRPLAHEESEIIHHVAEALYKFECVILIQRVS
jgi:hypothetical protein